MRDFQAEVKIQYHRYDSIDKLGHHWILHINKTLLITWSPIDTCSITSCTVAIGAIFSPVKMVPGYVPWPRVERRRELIT